MRSVIQGNHFATQSGDGCRSLIPSCLGCFVTGMALEHGFVGINPMEGSGDKVRSQSSTSVLNPG
jgi:hypothetical protein